MRLRLPQDARILPVALLVLAFGLVVAWRAPPGRIPLLAQTMVLLAAFALVAGGQLAERVLAAAAVAALGLQRWIPQAPLPFETQLRLEAAAAVLPPAIVLLLAHATRRHRPPTRLLAGLSLAFAFVGCAIRLLEISLLTGRPGDGALIRYALRLDLASALWGAAALALALPLVVGLLPRRRAGPRTAGALALAGFVVLGSGVPALVAASLDPPQVAIGFHADRVADVPEGAQIVHLEAAMPRVQPAPGVLRLDPLRQELDEAAARGLRVYLLVSTYPPRWLQEAFPESVMVDASGRPFLWIDEEPGAHSGRVWEMSFSDPRVLEIRREYVARVVAAVADHPAVAWVAVQNEPAYPLDWNLFRWASFDAATLAAFRETLRREMGGDLEALHDAYGTSFASWQEVEPPRVPLGDFGDRWTRFREDALVAHATALMDAARAHTDKPVTTKIMAHFLTRFAEPQAGLSDAVYRALVDASDVVSLDLYPATDADLVRTLDYFHGLAGGKPVIVAEFNLAFGVHLPAASLRLLRALETLDGRADAVILFTASRHYLYGVDADGAAGAALRLHALSFRDTAYLGALGGMARAEWEEWRAAPRDLARVASLLLAR